MSPSPEKRLESAISSVRSIAARLTASIDAAAPMRVSEAGYLTSTSTPKAFHESMAKHGGRLFDLEIQKGGESCVVGFCCGKMAADLFQNLYDGSIAMSLALPKAMDAFEEFVQEAVEEKKKREATNRSVETVNAIHRKFVVAAKAVIDATNQTE